MISNLNASPTTLSRRARVCLAAAAVAAIGAPLVYFSRSAAVVADESSPAAATSKEPTVEFLPPLTPAEEKILAALEKPTTMDFIETPLSDAIDYLKDFHSLEIQLDERALEEAGQGADTPVRFKISGISLRSALRMMLARLDLTFHVSDEVLQITTRDVADTSLITRTYPVGDLVEDNNYDGLVDAVTNTVKPQTWDAVGGPGTIVEIQGPKSLVILQTQDIHDEVLQLLRALRAARKAGGVSGPPSKATGGSSEKRKAKAVAGSTRGMGGGMF